MTWREIVARGVFTRADYVQSRSWHTCAVGEQRAAQPEVVPYVHTRITDRLTADEPADPRLRELGLEFYWAVCAQNAVLASAVLDDIEDRVLTLKRGGADHGDQDDVHAEAAAAQ